MTAEKKGLANQFLSELKESQSPVSIFLVNGVKLHGSIEAYDEEVVLLKGVLTQVVYKHAISTVVPAKISSEKK